MKLKQTIFIGKNFLGSMIGFLNNKIAMSKRGKDGFTLVELLVTITIFVILTGVVLFSQNNFDDSILLNNLAYDTALTIRQAQSYGVNTKEAPSGGFSPAAGAKLSYGVYFDISSPDYDKNFILFADTNDNKFTDLVSPCDSESECIQRYSIKRGGKISAICAGTPTSCNATDKLSIIFKRPSPDALIYNMEIGTPALQTYAKITVSSASGATKNIIVTSVGQIYVQK